MARHYIENPLLFVNSTDSSIPTGRNVRTKCRSQEAASRHALMTTEGVHFEVLNFRSNRSYRRERVKSSRKNRTRSSHTDNDNPVTSVGPLSQGITESMHGLPTSLVIPNIWPLAVNPLKVMAVATFHIRRISAMFLRRNPDRLAEVLRCRQWSYVPIALDSLGQSACVDSALGTVASKLCQMTGGPTSHYSVLSNYTSALRILQAALSEPKRHRDNDLLLTSQLLAVYEMLESLDNAAWTQHLAGARNLSWSKAAMSPVKAGDQACCSVPLLPMVTDALLNGNGYFFRFYNLQTPLHLVINDLQGYEELASSVSDIAELLIDAKLSSRSEKIDSGTRYALLDRAHNLKAHLRSGLLDSDLYSPVGCGGGGSFDRLGLYLAGLVSLDRLIESLRPVQTRAREASEDKTGELCAQLLQLELGAADAYPANDLLSAFELSAP